MLRALAASLTISTVVLGSCALLAYAADAPPPAATAPCEVRLTQPTPNFNAAAPDEDDTAETALLAYINQSRKQQGVPPVRMDDTLRQAARLHAQRMVKNHRLEHQFPGEPSLLQRIADVGPLQIDLAGENIANAGCPESADAVLMRSAPHRANLLDAHYTLAGVAAIWSRGRLYVVQDFGHEIPSYSASETARRVGEALDEARASNGLPELAPFTPPHLDEAACQLANEDRPNARLVAAAYSNRKVIAYTQSNPEILPPDAERVLENPNLRHFAVGSCYARNATYPTGIYWVAILLY